MTKSLKIKIIFEENQAIAHIIFLYMREIINIKIIHRVVIHEYIMTTQVKSLPYLYMNLLSNSREKAKHNAMVSCQESESE